MTAYSALAPVSAAVYTALNVAALTALAPGGVFDAIPQDTTYPAVLFDVQERWQPTLGTKPGVKRVMEMALRLHVFSQHRGMKEAQGVMAKAIQLLADPPTVSGYASWAIFHDETLPLSDQLVAGVPVEELVANFRVFVEEA